MNPRIALPNAADNTDMITSETKAPAKTVMREYLDAIIAAIKKVLSPVISWNIQVSPISDTTIMTNADANASIVSEVSGVAHGGCPPRLQSLPWMGGVMEMMKCTTFDSGAT